VLQRAAAQVSAAADTGTYQVAMTRAWECQVASTHALALASCEVACHASARHEEASPEPEPEACHEAMRQVDSQSVPHEQHRAVL